MDDDFFWKTIDASRRKAKGDLDAQVEVYASNFRLSHPTRSFRSRSFSTGIGYVPTTGITGGQPTSSVADVRMTASSTFELG
jgi:hypothetical protein